MFLKKKDIFLSYLYNRSIHVSIFFISIVGAAFCSYSYSIAYHSDCCKVLFLPLTDTLLIPRSNVTIITSESPIEIVDVENNSVYQFSYLPTNLLVISRISREFKKHQQLTLSSGGVTRVFILIRTENNTAYRYRWTNTDEKVHLSIHQDKQIHHYRRRCLKALQRWC